MKLGSNFDSHRIGDEFCHLFPAFAGLFLPGLFAECDAFLCRRILSKFYKSHQRQSVNIVCNLSMHARTAQVSLPSSPSPSSSSSRTSLLSGCGPAGTLSSLLVRDREIKSSSIPAPGTLRIRVRFSFAAAMEDADGIAVSVKIDVSTMSPLLLRIDPTCGIHAVHVGLVIPTGGGDRQVASVDVHRISI
jgi:hypothetical protein